MNDPSSPLTNRAGAFLQAWNSHDVVTTLACYTDDVVYQDPTTRGPIVGRAAFGRYLERLFSHWRMHWRLRELFPLADRDGAAVLWQASLTPRAGGPEHLVSGMDLALLRGGLIARNEVYYDRTPLLTPTPDPDHPR
jgi:ketosteroid isomerase-like protein